TRSCAGISGKSQILFAVVYLTRYLDLFTTYVSLYNSVMKVLFLATSGATVYLMYVKFKATYDHNHDSFRIEFLLVPCALLSLVLWTFSIYLESVAILPQLFLVSRTGEAESITSHYLFALGSYRALYLLNWVYRYMVESHYDLIAIFAGVVQTVLYCDFFYLDTGKYEQIVSTGLVSPERSVPEEIEKPPYYFKNLPPGNTLGSPEIKTPNQIEAMRLSGKLAARCGKLATVGTTTDEIDAFAHDRIIASNAYPSPLRYAGFPKSICTSINNIACHGIPDDLFFNGYHGDCSETFLVGEVDERGSFLVEATRSCLDQCISLCGPGVEFNEIGKFIENYCDERGLESIAAFIGHGIGSYFHDNEFPGKMQPGMTFTIEPILSLGGSEIAVLDDGWTAISLDGARSAQFEHTILITETGTEILTRD
ncbi:hypothetical protein M5D96_003682, partial [Drosophila gunungcola]